MVWGDLWLRELWSRCDKYCEYLAFQEEVQQKTGFKQLEWEEKAWMVMAQRHSME